MTNTKFDELIERILRNTQPGLLSTQGAALKELITLLHAEDVERLNATFSALADLRKTLDA